MILFFIGYLKSTAKINAHHFCEMTSYVILIKETSFSNLLNDVIMYSHKNEHFHFKKGKAL